MSYVRQSQVTFNQGELGLYLDGRYDNKLYQSGCREANNWLLLPHGGLLRRPGWQLIAQRTSGGSSGSGDPCTYQSVHDVLAFDSFTGSGATTWPPASPPYFPTTKPPNSLSNHIGESATWKPYIDITQQWLVAADTTTFQNGMGYTVSHAATFLNDQYVAAGSKLLTEGIYGYIAGDYYVFPPASGNPSYQYLWDVNGPNHVVDGTTVTIKYEWTKTMNAIYSAAPWNDLVLHNDAVGLVGYSQSDRSHYTSMYHLQTSPGTNDYNVQVDVHFTGVTVDWPFSQAAGVVVFDNQDVTHFSTDGTNMYFGQSAMAPISDLDGGYITLYTQVHNGSTYTFGPWQNFCCYVRRSSDGYFLTYKNAILNTDTYQWRLQWQPTEIAINHGTASGDLGLCGLIMYPPAYNVGDFALWYSYYYRQMNFEDNLVVLKNFQLNNFVWGDASTWNLVSPPGIR